MHEDQVRQGAGSVVAVTADDDRFEAARHAAIDLAVREQAELILYDWDAATALGDPLPSVWSADGTDTAVPDRLDVAALEAAGRDAIAHQIVEAERAGARASAWLPSSRGSEALIRYASDHGAIAIVVPAELADIGDGASPIPVRVV